MFKNCKKFLITILMIILLTGCWDYTSMNEMAIVTGIAVDKNPDDNTYNLTFEIVDLSESSKLIAVETKTVESNGSTIFDAVRNAKKRLQDKLYFSTAKIVIVSNQIAKEDGIGSVIDFFLRDGEVRETVSYAISAESTAKELLSAKDIVGPVLSFEIMDIIKEDCSVTSSTNHIEVRELFNILEGSGKSMAIPVLRLVNNSGDKVVESNGIAIFNEDKLINTIDPYESKYWLFIDNNVNGGILTLKIKDSDKDNVSLEISKSKTTKTFKYENGKYEFTVKIDTDVFIAGGSGLTYPLSSKVIKEIENNASKKIEQEASKLIRKAQEEFKTDIFSFGSLVYNNDPKMWKEIKPNWNEKFLDINVKVESTVHALNSAFIK